MSAYSPARRQDAAAPASDDQRWTARGRRDRGPGGVRDLVVLAREGGASVAPHGAHDGEALGQPGHAHRRRVHRDPRLLVVGRHPAGTEPELETALRDDVECRRLLGHEDGMPEVVVEDERAHSECRRGLGRHRDGDHGGPLIVEVVRHVEGRVAQVLGLPRQVTPRSGGCGVRRLQGEAEGGHGRRSYGVNLVR